MVLVASRAIFPKTPLALAFKAAKWKNSDELIYGWAMCIKCEEWVNCPSQNGSNVLKRHIDHCGFDGYSFLAPADLATLVANCLRFGGFKVNTDDLKKSFQSYPMITKHVV